MYVNLHLLFIFILCCDITNIILNINKNRLEMFAYPDLVLHPLGSLLKVDHILYKKGKLGRGSLLELKHHYRPLHSERKLSHLKNREE